MTQLSLIHTLVFFGKQINVLCIVAGWCWFGCLKGISNKLLTSARNVQMYTNQWLAGSQQLPHGRCQNAPSLHLFQLKFLSPLAAVCSGHFLQNTHSLSSFDKHGFSLIDKMANYMSKAN